VRVVIALLLAACGGAGQPVVEADPCASSSAAAFPSASLYNLTADLETSDGSRTCLARWRGHKTLVSMFYASCTAACPLTIQKIQSVLSRVPQAARDDARVLLVSFDPERDDPAAMARLAEAHHIDAPRWVLARAPEPQVRELSAALGIAYKKQPNGEFDHTAVFTVLDAEGVPVARVDGLGADDAGLVEALSGE
jgi:protein SCO1